MDHREKKLARKRDLAAAKRELIKEIEQLGPADRTPAQQALLDRAAEQRRKKNERAKKRLKETQHALSIIIAKPEEHRTIMEKAFVEHHLTRKLRKNCGDKLRKMRAKFGDIPHFRQEPLPRRNQNLQRINYNFSAFPSRKAESVLKNEHFEDLDSETDKTKQSARKDHHPKHEATKSLQEGCPFQGQSHRSEPQPSLVR